MNKRVILPLLAGAIALGGVLYLTARIHDEGEEGASPIYGNVDIREATLSFRVGGRVSQIAVDEGDQIKAGAVLAQLDQAPLENSLRAAEASVAALSARSALLHQGYRAEDQKQASARVVAARAALTEAERQLKRQHSLKPQGATTQSALDTAQSQRDQAAAQLRVAEADLQKMSTGYRTEEMAEADANLAQAKANLAAARLALSDATLTAPADGILLTRAIEVGEMVQSGSSAFTLSLTTPVWVRAYVPEPQLGHYPAGASVTLWSDSRPEHPYHGVVGFVSPNAEFTPKNVETTDLRTALVYRIRIVVKDADAMLRQGMPVTVRIAP